MTKAVITKTKIFDESMQFSPWHSQSECEKALIQLLRRNASLIEGERGRLLAAGTSN